MHKVGRQAPKRFGSDMATNRSCGLPPRNALNDIPRPWRVYQYPFNTHRATMGRVGAQSGVRDRAGV